MGHPLVQNFNVVTRCRSDEQMEYSASVMNMLAENFWHIVEGFVEFPANLLDESMICRRNGPDDDLLFVQQ